MLTQMVGTKLDVTSLLAAKPRARPCCPRPCFTRLARLNALVAARQISLICDEAGCSYQERGRSSHIGPSLGPVGDHPRRRGAQQG